MQIKNAYLMEPDFISAFDELLRKPMPAKQCLEMITSSEIITQQYNRLIKAQLTILQRHAHTKEDGGLIFDAEQNLMFKSPQDEEAAKKEVSDLKSDVTEIPLTNKVKVYEDDISTPRKIFLLKDLIEITDREKPVVPGQEVK